MELINIVIPMAGLGIRFKNAGFKNIKPLIPLNGKTFIEWSIDSVDFKSIKTQFIFVILEEHRDKLEPHLKSIKQDCIICSVPVLTRGAVETALSAKDFINNDIPLIITNSDQIFEWDKEKYIDYLIQSSTEANVITVKSDTDKFSYILLDENNNGIKLTEKEVISNNALAGIHYWKKGKYFVDSGIELIRKDIRSKNEYYVSLTYNLLIEKGIKVTHYGLSDSEKYLSIGTPEQVYDYINYKNMNISVDKIENYTRGWFVGKFHPSLLKDTDIEIGYLSFKKGEQIDFHYHEHCKEINVLVKGKMIVNDIIINEGDIFVFEPFVPTIPIYLEDTSLIVIKNKPSATDKVIM